MGYEPKSCAPGSSNSTLLRGGSSVGLLGGSGCPAMTCTVSKVYSGNDVADVVKGQLRIMGSHWDSLASNRHGRLVD